MRPSDLVFFTSGFAALLYQVAWARLATRTLGADAFGAAVVIATFMGGMALGSALAGRGWLARCAHPARAFAAISLVAAGAAASTAPWVGFAAGSSRTTDALITAALLLPSTLAMGATFPLMGRLTEAEDAALGARTSSFYGANTLGAALGALAATFVALPSFGLRATILAGSAADVAAGLGALILLGKGAAAPALRPRATAAPAGRPWRLLTVTALLGLSSLALEVVLTRLLVGLTGASVYAFGLVLAAYLVVLGLGARQARTWLAGAVDPTTVLARSAAGAVAAACLGLVALSLQVSSGDVFQPLANRTPTASSVGGLWFSQAVVCAIALVPPAVAFGLALPAAIAAASPRDDDRASEPGRLADFYVANTLGAALGALLAAWWLLPAFGLRGATLAALAPALVAWLATPTSARSERIGMALGLSGLLWFGILRPGGAELDVVEQAVGPVATAVVERMPGEEAEHLALRIDGKVVASSAPVDLRLQRLLAAIPAALHGDVRSAVVIGLGMGTTAGALAELDSLEALRVVELSPSVAAVGPSFAPWTGDLLEDPRLELTLGDGRSFAARTAELPAPRFDLVTADPIHPWTRGSSDLYAVEHFERLRLLLAPGGIASQWLPLYQLSTDDVRTVVASWCSAFEDVSAWLTAYDLVLVGSAEPPRTLSDLAQGSLPRGLEASLAAIGVADAADMVALCVADDRRLRAFAGDTPPMSEDRPVLEFNAPKSFLAGYAEEVLAWAADDGFAAELPPAARLEAGRLRNLVRTFLAELPGGAAAAARRFGDRLLTPKPTDEGL